MVRSRRCPCGFRHCGGVLLVLSPSLAIVAIFSVVEKSVTATVALAADIAVVDGGVSSASDRGGARR